MTLGLEESSKVPVVHVGEEVIAQLFGSVDSLRNLQKMIDGSMHGFSVPLRNAEATIRTSTEIQDMSASNVVGFIEGRDPVLKHEIVVVGAHYDHVGYNKDHAPGEDYIFNGADDNASGTSALLGVAAAFGALKVHPGRSILLIAFCGEEKGLFGSEYYVRNPLFPLAKTVAMINLDMVGRNAPDSLFIIDASRVPDLALIAREESERAGFHLVDDEHAPGGSDHMNFLKKNVPSIFYHSGLHKDYHKVSDEPSLINTEKLARVAHLAFTTAWRCASDTAHFGLIKKPISLF
jgi:Zn-dependent M28 family amino/carboxypeptidase